MNLLETYKKRLTVSESLYGKAHGNEQMTENYKATIAKVLQNTSAYLNEAFATQGSATQRADMGNYKKFCLNLTTVAMPTLIANDLVIVKPMSSITGFIQYIKFVAGTTKGGVTAGETVFNDPFRLGEMNEDRANYTSNKVVETYTEAPTKVAWTPCIAGAVKAFAADGSAIEGITVTADGTLAGTSLANVRKVAYEYDNIVIPQDNIPSLKATVDTITLTAKARRLAIFYSQMAAFQAKQEMGMDLAGTLETQAVAELEYETDTEVINLLKNNAELPAGNITVFNKHLPYGVATKDHYVKFAEIVSIASQVIYTKTLKHMANYLVIASDILPILSVIDGFKAATLGKIAGAFFAGTLNGVKVYVSPVMTPSTWFVGYNGDDLATSAAVYAPYMAIVPTAALQFADGGTTKGFSTMYDLQLLNKDLLVAGKVVDEEYVVNTKEQA